jgi:predicted RNase H-like HicB family nuclease
MRSSGDGSSSLARPDFIAVFLRGALGIFVVEFPGLPECIALSTTLEEIPGAAADALCTFLEAME